MKTFQEYIIAARESTAVVQPLIEKTGILSKMTKHALLVGIDDYLSHSITPSRGAVNDVLALKQVLTTKFGFVEENITTLLNHTATYSTILESFKQLVGQACNEPALFYFSGNGSLDKDGFPVIISVDGREGQVYDIHVQELYELAKANAHNLVSILDAGFQRAEHGSRYTKMDTRVRPTRRNIVPRLTFDQAKIDTLRIGHICIYPYSVVSAGPEYNSSEDNLQLPSFETKSKYHGVLTYSLIRGLEKWKESTITYAQWFDSASKYSHDRFVVLGEHEGEQWFSGDTILEFLQKPPFDNSVLREEVVALITKLEQTSIYETIRLLRRMIEQRQQQNDYYPEGHLNLGLAYSVIGDYDGSVDHLERAISLYSDQSVMSREKRRDLDS